MQKELERTLAEFYGERKNVERILPILNHTSPVSFRLLDFFVVNFARQNKISYWNKDEMVDVYPSYRRELDTYSKEFFDPFRRSEKLLWTFPGDGEHLTTLGQLCFLRWVATSGIIEYIEGNLPRISQAMKDHLSRPPDCPQGERRSRAKGSRRRNSVTVTAIRARATVGDRWVIHFD